MDGEVQRVRQNVYRGWYGGEVVDEGQVWRASHVGV